ncbi:hypothetical protein ACFSKW_20715 [Nonomuraea mangrovi]|uniref:Uncharacterized protein n=1 Tax=Nonomuraea mangrovi TaxID=2316207 RepID=A0ABW4SY45_9ACTN
MSGIDSRGRHFRRRIGLDAFSLDIGDCSSGPLFPAHFAGATAAGVHVKALHPVIPAGYWKRKGTMC